MRIDRQSLKYSSFFRYYSELSLIILCISLFIAIVGCSSTVALSVCIVLINHLNKSLFERS